MFSSLASYLFGSNTTNTNSETAPKTRGIEDIIEEDFAHSVDTANLIEVTSLTPSVTGVGDRRSSSGNSSANAAAAAAANNSAIKRGKNKRNNARQQNKRKGLKTHSPSSKSGGGEHITRKQSSRSENCDEDFDEDEWYIVEKEDDFDVSPPRNAAAAQKQPSDAVLEIVKSVKHQPSNATRNHLTQQPRPLQHINSHSLYSGPRPQKQRNYLQKSRNNNNNSNNNHHTRLSVSTLSPSRTVNDGRVDPTAGLTADGGMTRSLYVAPSAESAEKVNNATKLLGDSNGLENGSNKKMDESWFVTPPPCFTSIGPINMETSPYENLLIEHPSMSVYHSIKTAQEAAECFVKLDLGVKERKERKEREEKPAKENIPRKNPQTVQQRSSAGFRLDRQSVAQLKQELMARSVQKSQSKRERKDIRRSSINRANKARDVESRNHTSRRSDRQHCKIVSRANNNRKSCF